LSDICADEAFQVLAASIILGTLTRVMTRRRIEPDCLRRHSHPSSQPAEASERNHRPKCGPCADPIQSAHNTESIATFHTACKTFAPASKYVLGASRLCAFDATGIAASLGVVHMDVMGVRIFEEAIDDGLDILTVNNISVEHHAPIIECS
jgi:hypothetical protein